MSFVIDASVYNKLFLIETDSTLAEGVFRKLIGNRSQWFAPMLLPYEMCSTALHHDVDFQVPLSLLESHRELGLQIVTPRVQVWRQAQEIAQSRHDGHGHPSLDDSIYHALAIDLGMAFLTSDKHHAMRARPFGHVRLLDEVDLNE